MMITTRRSFISKTTLGLVGLSITKLAEANNIFGELSFPIALTTGKHGLMVNEAAWEILSGGGYALDAVEAGIRLAEADPGINSVGYGSFPDSRGKITLDACIMNDRGDAGSVAFLQCIKHPVSVARQAMEKTPHGMLSGKGAEFFAFDNGFKKEKLLTNEMRRRWRKWKKGEQGTGEEHRNEAMPEEDFDSIGMLAIDEKGRLCGACSAGGAPFMMHGMVGSSSIFGAGLYIDGEVGGAVAAGSVELIIKNLCAFMVVEFMRSGMSPEEACNAVIARIVKKNPDNTNLQIGFIALTRSGETGAASLHPGFNYAIKSKSTSILREAGSWFKKL